MLRDYFDQRRGDDVHLRLVTKVEIDGTVLQADSDAVAVETTPGTTMLVPFTAIQFIRESTETLRPIVESARLGTNASDGAKPA